MRKPTAAGSPALLALTLAVIPASGCGGEPTQVEDAAAAASSDDASEDVHAPARARLAAWEQDQHERLDYAELPASDGRFGSDPYRLLALPDGRVAVLLRGADRLVLLDAALAITASAKTPHDPTDLIWRDGELLVVGTGEARIARYAAADLDQHDDLVLVDGVAPRALASSGAWVFVADEGNSALHQLHFTGAAAGEVEASSRPYCHGPIALAVVDDLLIGNCLLEHRLRVDRLAADGTWLDQELEGIRHDGPIWSFAVGPREPDGDTLVALTGVEDHALDRSDGGFGYIDSFAWIYALDADGFERRASLNLSEQGVVTPKWSVWGPDSSLRIGGYATAPIVDLRWPTGFDDAPEIHARAGLPGTRDALWVGPDSMLAADPLLDRIVVLGPEDTLTTLDPAPEQVDDRRFEHRLGEALVFTTAMAPRNSSEDKRSRFTCETCHLEGRGDGRIHYTGREREGVKVHAVSKTLQGLFNNRPHFSRALDRQTATMVDNEFRVANRHSELEPWFTLSPELVPWIVELEGWPGAAVEGETLRLALLEFLVRYTPPSNPATRGRAAWDTPEAEGATLFAEHCESCHQARLVADDPTTRLAFANWESAIFSANAPIVWASDAYVQTGIVPWVHAEGARVPSLRRLYLDWPYFTNGEADSLAAVLEGIRVSEDGCDHQLGPASAAETGLDEHSRAALLAFVRLL